MSSLASGAARGLAEPAIDEAQLLQRCRRGDMTAFAQFIARYQDRIYNALLRLCGNTHDAEELSQEAFVKAYEGLSGFRADSGFYTWVFRIAVNLTLSRRRRAQKVKFHSLDAPAGEQSSEHTLSDARQADPAEAASRNDLHQHVLAALAGLDDEYKVVVVLRDLEGMDYHQIGQVLALPPGTVKSRLFRARSMLQQKLGHLL